MSPRVHSVKYAFGTDARVFRLRTLSWEQRDEPSLGQVRQEFVGKPDVRSNDNDKRNKLKGTRLHVSS